MIKKSKRIFLVVLAVAMLIAIPAQPYQVRAADYGGIPFVANPQTAYAGQFIALCDGEQWFLNVMESILNVHAMSINTIASQVDLDRVISVGLF